jgi:hypothetical protein
MRSAQRRSPIGLSFGIVFLMSAGTQSAFAQYQTGPNGVGRCGGVDPDSATLASVIAKPDSKPRRLDSSQQLSVGQGAFRLATMEDTFKNYVGHIRRVAVTALIDTTGHVVPGSVAITSSSSARLSSAVCDALPHMQFRPAKMGRAVVLAQYAESLQFIGTSATSADRGPQDQSSVR